MPRVLLTLPVQKQRSDGDCLAACAAMVLAYWGRNLAYDQLLRLLNIKSYGAPARNVLALRRLDFSVVYSQTDMSGLETLLRQGSPVIVFVRTGQLPYWSYNTDHALVVVGFDETNVYVHDPYGAQAAVAVSKGDFELAWLERDYYYALIRT